MKHWIINISVICCLFGNSLSAQDDVYSLDQIHEVLDSAQLLEGQLKVKSALSYYESLITPVNRLLRLDSLDSELWKINGIVISKTGSTEEAYESFRRAVVLDSTDLENQIEYIRYTMNTAKDFANNGFQYKSQKWLQNSYDVLAVAIRTHPDNHELHELAGDIYASTNDIENCTYHYQEAFNLKKDKEIALKLYRLYAVTKDYKNEVKMAGLLSERYSTYGEYYAVQAQLGLNNIQNDIDEQSRYLPGVKRTMMMAIQYGSQNPDTYMNYFEIIKMGYAFDSGYKVEKKEIIMVLEKASKVLDEVENEKANILIAGAELLRDLGHINDACEAYSTAKSLNTIKTTYSSIQFCK